MNNQVAKSIAEALGWQALDVKFQAVSGGSIAGSWKLQGGSALAFIKTMGSSRADMLDAERDGLQRLADSGAVRTPSMLGHGSIESTAWLALEWLDMRPLDGAGHAALGRQLSDLHRCRADKHGLDTDNFIGATVQPNTRTADWTAFLFEQRLGFQLDLLAERAHGFGRDDRARLEAAWRRRFPDYAPQPSLLHGDLWGGNAAMLPDGQPVLFDPAAHFGDRECDLAMADLFGGFDSTFFDAYQQQWPLDHGWQDRRPFYKLYHMLNHANLFGGHYPASCRRLIDQLGN